MQSYEFTVCLLPSGIFGLPDDGWQIIRARAGTVYSDAIDSLTGNIMEFGTLSSYRDFEERLAVQFEFGDVQVSVSDNRMTMSFVSENIDTATVVHEQAVLRFVAYLSTELGINVSSKLLQATENGSPIPSIRPSFIQRVRSYNLMSLRNNFIKVGDSLNGLADPQLDQALRYYAEAGDLEEMMESREYLTPQCFLQYWKALATIAGDPSRDHDHQAKCKRYGLDQRFFATDVKPLHDIRNKFDVAHIASLQSPLFVARADVQRCKEVAQTLIHAYATYLRSHADP